MKELIRLALVIALFAVPAAAQTKFALFPQVADGAFSDGTYYKTTFMIYPWFDTTSPQCTLVFYGLRPLIGTTRSSSFSINQTPGSLYVSQTAADQAFSSGFAALSCTEFVSANVLYTFYSADGIKISEATVFPSTENSRFRLVLDYREDARLGVAVANNTDASHTYRLTLGTRTGTFTVPAHRSMSRFVDEVLTVRDESVALLKVEATDLSQFSVIGLRYTGGAFTTIPAQGP